MNHLLEITNLKKHFPIHSGLLLRRTGTVYAVDDVSFYLDGRETLGLVGESGCGKSTLGRTVIKIYEPTSGQIHFENNPVTHLKGVALKNFRHHVQMIFQDPYSSLNPRMTIASILDQPMRIHGRGGNHRQRQEVIKHLLARVGLDSWALNRYPHEFSGGQRQRVAIARALTLHPKIIVADEAVSALDVSVQSQILNLMKDLQQEFGMAYLFIAHDLAVVRHMAERVAVMYLGKIVEMGSCETLFKAPQHPYTQALMAAIPEVGKKRAHRLILKGDVPSPVKPPSGCHFHPRCPFAEERCQKEVPELKNVSTTEKPYFVSCHLVKT